MKNDASVTRQQQATREMVPRRAHPSLELLDLCGASSSGERGYIAKKKKNGSVERESSTVETDLSRLNYIHTYCQQHTR